MAPAPWLASIVAKMSISLKGSDFLTSASVGGALAPSIFRNRRAQPALPSGEILNSCARSESGAPISSSAPQYPAAKMQSAIASNSLSSGVRAFEICVRAELRRRRRG